MTKPAVLPSFLPHDAESVRQYLNQWQPLLHAGIEISHIADDFTRIQAVLRHNPATQNSHGTQFGGSLFAMTDVIYPMMLQHYFAGRCYIWDKSAAIEFVKPGRGDVFLDCTLERSRIEEIEAAIADGEKYLPEFEVRIFDGGGETVAIAKRTLYIRLRKELRPENNK